MESNYFFRSDYWIYPLQNQSNTRINSLINIAKYFSWMITKHKYTVPTKLFIERVINNQAIQNNLINYLLIYQFNRILKSWMLDGKKLHWMLNQRSFYYGIMNLTLAWLINKFLIKLFSIMSNKSSVNESGTMIENFISNGVKNPYIITVNLKFYSHLSVRISVSNIVSIEVDSERQR